MTDPTPAPETPVEAGTEALIQEQVAIALQIHAAALAMERDAGFEFFEDKAVGFIAALEGMDPPVYLSLRDAATGQVRRDGRVPRRDAGRRGRHVVPRRPDLVGHGSGRHPVRSVPVHSGRDADRPEHSGVAGSRVAAEPGDCPGVRADRGGKPVTANLPFGGQLLGELPGELPVERPRVVAARPCACRRCKCQYRTMSPRSDLCRNCRLGQHRFEVIDLTGTWIVGDVAGVEVWERVPDEPIADDPPACRVCGCTDDRACPEGCAWVEADLCSSCVGADVE